MYFSKEIGKYSVNLRIILIRRWACNKSMKLKTVLLFTGLLCLGWDAVTLAQVEPDTQWRSIVVAGEAGKAGGEKVSSLPVTEDEN